MSDVKTIPELAKEERKASKDYKLKAKYERKFGNKKLADVFDELANDEEKHRKELKRLYKM